MPMLRNVRAPRLLLAAALTTVALSSGCGGGARHAGDASHLDAIATDLPDDGGPGPVHLFWVSSNAIFRGMCEGREPLIRANCGDDLQSMNYDVFRKRLDNGLSQTIIDLTNEAARLQQTINVVQAEIQKTLDALAAIEQQNGHLTAELEQLRAQVRKFQQFVAELQDQITMIDQELRRLADQDLMAQREIVVKQLADYQHRLDALGPQIQAVSRQIDALGQQAAELQTKLNSLTARLDNLRGDLAGVTTQLSAAYDDFSVYELTIRRLESGIVASVLRDNVLYQRERQFVKRFEKIFAADRR
jgi:chromosome segregation ATPase